MNEGMTEHSISLVEVHAISVGLLQDMQDQGMETSLAATAMAMSIGRMMSPQLLTPPEEVAFIQHLIEWVGLYFTKGTVN